MIIYTPAVKGHLEHVGYVLTALWKAELSINFAKFRWFCAQQEFFCMVVDRLGLRPAPSKIEAVANLRPASTVEELRALLGMTGFLRKFVPLFSEIVAPLTDVLRNPNFASKRARKHKIPWGPAQDETLAKLIYCLTSAPILILSSWIMVFNLHTDASELGAGAALAQTPEEAERIVAFACHQWSRSDSKRSPTEREVMAVLWAVEHFRSYLWGRRFTPRTDCSALTWLFKSQTLTPKLYRWALRLMEYDMDLKWKAGQNHLPDALSRLPRFETP